MSEMLTSRIYGNLGRYEQVRQDLRRSESGRVHLLGKGALGGKGEGTLVLDHARHKGMVSGYSVPRSLVLCESFSANPRRNEVLFEILRELGFHRALAIRSSSPFEDQLGQTAAGIFATEFHALPLDTDESRAQFAAKLTAVYESANSERARAYLQRRDLGNHPLSVVIQEVVGSQWQYAPQYFMPAIAGITNTSQHSFVKSAVVLGLGLSAVGDEGLGRLYRLPIKKDGTSVGHNLRAQSGDFNTTSLYCLDLHSGNQTRLQGENARRMFPRDFLQGLTNDWPGAPRSIDQIYVSEMALDFERSLGFPVDIEWASEDGRITIFLQIRPISKRQEIAKPQIDPSNILLETSDMLGYGQKIFDHIIFVHGTPSRELIELTRKYPRSLIVYRPDEKLNKITTPMVLANKLLPLAESVVVVDPDPSDHMTGTGMQHLALNMADDKKIIILSRPAAVEEIIQKGGICERFDHPLGCHYIRVYQFDRSIHLAADDDAGWAMVWVE